MVVEEVKRTKPQRPVAMDLGTRDLVVEVVENCKRMVVVEAKAKVEACKHKVVAVEVVLRMEGEMVVVAAVEVEARRRVVVVVEVLYKAVAEVVSRLVVVGNALVEAANVEVEVERHI